MPSTGGTNTNSKNKPNSKNNKQKPDTKKPNKNSNKTNVKTVNYKVRIVTKTATIRETADVKGKKVETVKKDETYKIVKTKGNWGKLSNGKGWIDLSQTQRIIKEYKVQVETDTANIRSSANEFGNVVGSVKKGEKLTIVKVNGNYGKLSDGRGWILLNSTTLIEDNDIDYTGTSIDMSSMIETTKYTTNVSDERLEHSISNSMRMFGLPHQFLSYNDTRMDSTSNLGRCFAERIIMEAPIVCFQPGVPDFLPGKSNKKKKDWLNGIIDITKGNASLESVFGKMSFDKPDDNLVYYSLKEKYSQMMAKVNILCKLMAVFLGIQDEPVPWAKGNVTFGNYDWRYYTVKNQFNNVEFTQNKSSKKGSIGAFIKDSIVAAIEDLSEDTKWVRFYVDSSSSFSESASNSTTSSILESYTEKLEGVAKELDVISDISGVKVNSLMKDMTSSADSWIQEHATGDGPIATMLNRMAGAAKDIVLGGNFLIPEIWSQSEYSKNYSFSITLSTPYGCKESWFLNIGVPLMHILGLSLPQQLSANTYKSPYLVRCYSPGWFNCNLGIIDSLSIEKGADSSWNVGGLPNEIKVNISVRDLYATLSIPVEPYTNAETFLSTGMLEFLMVNCGVDITNQNIMDRFQIWSTILMNNFTDRFTAIPFDAQQFFRNKVQKLFNII